MAKTAKNKNKTGVNMKRIARIATASFRDKFYASIYWDLHDALETHLTLIGCDDITDDMLAAVFNEICLNRCFYYNGTEDKHSVDMTNNEIRRAINVLHPAPVAVAA